MIVEMSVQRIADGLDRFQWMELRTILNKRRFDYDIVGELPIEIIIMIFSYLTPEAPFKYQSVSKKWLDKLSSLEILDASLSQWYSKSDPPLLGEFDTGRSEWATRYLKLEHMQRFRNGEHSSYAEINIGSPSLTGVFPFHRDLSRNRIAWINRTDTRIVVLDLATKDSFFLHGMARENIYAVFLSEELLLCVTGNTTQYVCDLKTRERRSLRLPSSRLGSWGVSGRTAVYLIKLSTSSLLIVSWNFDTRKMTFFQPEAKYAKFLSDRQEANHKMIRLSTSIVTTSDKDTVAVLFYGENDSDLVIAAEKYDFSGKVVQSRQDYFYDVDWPRIVESSSNVDKVRAWTLRQTSQSYEGHHNLCFTATVSLNDQTLRTTGPLMFLFDYQTMEIKYVDAVHNSINYASPLHRGNNRGQLIRWKTVQLDPFNKHHVDKDTLYSRNSDITECIMHQSYTEQDESGSICLKPVSRVWPSNLKDVSSIQVPEDSLCCNDRYIVCFIERYILIWAFDPDANLENLRRKFSPRALRRNPIDCAWSADEPMQAHRDANDANYDSSDEDTISYNEQLQDLSDD